MNDITIIIIDDHPLFRQGVVDALSLEKGFKVIALAINGREGLDLIRDWQPFVAVVDVNLPEMNGQQLTRQVVAEKIPTRVLLLTAYDDQEQQLHALRVGAAAYCTKDVQPEELIKIIRHVVDGKYVVNGQVLSQEGKNRWLKREIEGSLQPYSDPGEPFQPLSTREMEVLTQLTRGMSNKEIAVALGISHQTVKNHVTAIFRKLGVEDRTQATIYALRRGWVRLHQEEINSSE
jgi:DNA-binding NarL/FixJ family response regulator